MIFQPRIPLNLVCFCLYVVGVLTAFGISIGGGAPFPYMLCGVAGLLAALCILPYLLCLRLKDCWPIVAYLALATVCTGIAAEQDYLVRSARGILQLYYSVALAAGLYFIVLSIPREKMVSICLIVCVIMALASVLEFFGPLRNLSDSFRQLASPNWGYDNDARDLAMHGAVRSKVFSPEPSVAATCFFWISMMFLWSMTVNPRHLVLWLMAAVVMLWTVRSPTLVVAFAFACITTYTFQLVGAGR